MLVQHLNGIRLELKTFNTNKYDFKTGPSGVRALPLAACINIKSACYKCCGTSQEMLKQQSQVSVAIVDWLTNWQVMEFNILAIEWLRIG